MTKPIQKIAKNIKETERIALKFLDKILKDSKNQKGATIVALSGDLGAGKTAFTQFVGKHFGVKNKITSPTFVILKKYQIKKPKKYTHMIHIDAYRFESEKDVSSIRWDEIISNKEYIIFVEWPENIEKALPAGTSYVYISHMKDGYRNLKLK